jgi:1-acyl-sn-glycerol-3-phosphate acyltransferase
MNRIFSTLFWIFFVTTTTAFFAVAMCVWCLALLFDRQRRWCHAYACVWARFYAALYPGWDVVVLGREKITPQQPYVMVANHTSIADIILCFLLRTQFKWVSKKEVFKVPLIGWYMACCKYIPLARGRAQSIKKMYRTCQTWLMQERISIMMFPEGTRSPTGEVLPFKSGAFSLARDAGVLILPVAISGGAALIPKHGAAFSLKAKLRVQVLDPIDPRMFDNVPACAEAVRKRIAEAVSY